MPEDDLQALLRQRPRDLGKIFKPLATAAGLASTCVYKLADGVTLDPSVGTLVRLAGACSYRLRTAPALHASGHAETVSAQPRPGRQRILRAGRRR